MPELPDVESFRGVLASCAEGRRVARAEVADAGVLRGVTAGRFARDVEGRRFAAPRRHGKWLVAPMDGGDGPTVLMHFGMTGSLVCAAPGEPPAPHDRVTFALDDGRRLRFRDQRKLRGIWLAASADEAARVMGEQGPDALSVGRGELGERLAGRRQGVKAALLDQAVVSGLGNLLGDEILWQARVHPGRRTDRLSAADRRRLDTALHRVLRDSVRAGHVPERPSWLTGHRYDEDPACPRCGGPLARRRVGGRTTAWCPRCQPRDGE